MRLPRFTTRRWALALVLLALILRYVHERQLAPYRLQRDDYHGLMSDLCNAEAALMEHRATLCHERNTTDTPWDDPSGASEDLKCCPYPNDLPMYGSWLEQEAVWTRAAARSRRAAAAWEATR